MQGLPVAFMVMSSSGRRVEWAAAFLAAGLVLLYALLGEAKPAAEWRWLDLLGEGGTAVMAACWMHIVLGSRPAGRVTLLLALGLGGVALGMWADGLDELFQMKDAPRIDKWLESGLVPLGMAVLTAGLVGWRQEQFRLSEHMQLRERLFREHRDFDRITQLARVDYLRDQVRLEQATQSQQPASLVMVEVTGLQAVLHGQGRRDAVRALQAVTHQLLLNLRNDDLLCRYSGDRFVLLLPRTPLAQAQGTAQHLQRMVQAMRFHGQDGSLAELVLHSACAQADADVNELLSRLNRALESSSLPTQAASA